MIESLSNQPQETKSSAPETTHRPHPPSRLKPETTFRLLTVLPTILALLLVVGYPIAYALFVSLHRYDLTEGGLGPFTRLTNFRAILHLDVFRDAAQNTALLTVSVVGLELLVALALALLLNQPNLKFKSLYLAILLIPLLVSPIAVGLIWRLLLHPDLGAVNWALEGAGLPGQQWLSRQDTAMPAVVGVDVWHETSLLLVILLAGLTALPREPMEAAVVDGANRWQILRTITLPLLAPVMLVAVLIRMIAAMKTYDLIYILTAGGPGGATETISFRIWKVGFTNLDMGRAAAASILLLLVILALTLLLIRLIQPNNDT